jgi:CRISPR-associated protein Cas5t
MLYLYLEAPFAACRTFTAGWYRPTATFLTPSAAYGLLLNIAGIESRLREAEDGHDGKTPATYMKRGLPACRLALGTTNEVYPRLHSIYQQLHTYPVGATGKARADECKGNKYNITPVRREFLSELRAVIALDGNPDLEDRVRRGLRNEFSADRYGVPFLGDNAFLLDRLEEVNGPHRDIKAINWYEKLSSETTSARPRATRLTCLIDRADLSKTQSALFAPTVQATPPEIPPSNAAWVDIQPPAVPPPPPPKKSRSKKS